MLNASDALRAHASCKALAMQCLRQPVHCMSYFDFKPHPHCDITQFIRELEIRHRDWLEVAILKAAHHSYHAVLMDIANRKITGEEVDFEIEFAPDSPLERASAAVVAAVWRLERRLHSMAG